MNGDDSIFVKLRNITNLLILQTQYLLIEIIMIGANKITVTRPWSSFIICFLITEHLLYISVLLIWK